MMAITLILLPQHSLKEVLVLKTKQALLRSDTLTRVEVDEQTTFVDDGDIACTYSKAE